MPLYKLVLKAFGEKKGVIDSLVEIKETGISIERFERITKSAGFEIDQKQFYLFNPVYKYKFGLKPRKQMGLIGAIPWVRNFLTTCVYYSVIQAK